MARPLLPALSQLCWHFSLGEVTLGLVVRRGTSRGHSALVEHFGDACWLSLPWWLSGDTPASEGDAASIPGSGGSPGEGNGSLPVVLPGKAHGPGRATVHGVQRFRHDIVTKQQATDCILPLSEGERSLSLLAAQGLPSCLRGMAGSFQLVLSACFKVSG